MISGSQTHQTSANYRIERHERDQVPSGGMSVRGAHAER